MHFKQYGTLCDISKRIEQTSQRLRQATSTQIMCIAYAQLQLHCYIYENAIRYESVALFYIHISIPQISLQLQG